MTHASDHHAIDQTRRVWPPRTSRPLTREDARPIADAVTECFRLAEWDLVGAPWSRRFDQVSTPGRSTPTASARVAATGQRRFVRSETGETVTGSMSNPQEITP